MKKILVLISAALLFPGLHPYYVSICQIDHNPKSSALEITLKLFTDDFEAALKANGSGKLFLGTKKERKDAGKVIAAYVRERFEIDLGGKTREFEFIGHEVEHDLTYLYLEVPDVETLKEIAVTNTVLMERFDAQNNIVHISYRKQLKSMLLHRDKTRDSVVFE